MTSESTVPSLSREPQQLAPKPSRKKRRIARNGKATNDLVFSAFTVGNDRAFPQILALYVRPNSIVADGTYGKGVSWRYIPEALYQLRATDILTG